VSVRDYEACVPVFRFLLYRPSEHRRAASVSILVSHLKSIRGHAPRPRHAQEKGAGAWRQGVAGRVRGRQGDDAGGILQGHGVMVFVSTGQDRRRPGSVPEAKLSSISRKQIQALPVQHSLQDLPRTCDGGEVANDRKTNEEHLRVPF
jgi:hypothetical protein